MIEEKTLKRIENVPNACCMNPENIELLPTTNPNLIIRRCKVCHCNHYFMLAEPGQMGVRLAKP